ncbi:TIGR00153 family protein [Kushneria aurantia]|uniref:TIGR00153 family protein n=1 Tax=Kushneria aurantia TaxID=504092 RepID=A0ABV6G3C0_9GAMM|nr:TIGR00153 family protein [Kushneria aurantia]
MVSSNPFSALFGRSPFQPLIEHIDKTVECADLLPPFFEATLAGDWQRASELRDRISNGERDADELKTRIRMSLPSSIFLPVSRSDLLELISVQDKIANKIKDIAGIMLGRQMQIPAAMVETFSEYLGTAVASVHQTREAMAEMDDMLESGFGRNVSELLTDQIRKLHDLEHQADEQQVMIRRRLFELEKTLPPVDVMFLYRIIDWIGEVSDRAERAGSRLQILLAR